MVIVPYVTRLTFLTRASWRAVESQAGVAFDFYLCTLLLSSRFSGSDVNKLKHCSLANACSSYVHEMHEWQEGFGWAGYFNDGQCYLGSDVSFNSARNLEIALTMLNSGLL